MLRIVTGPRSTGSSLKPFWVYTEASDADGGPMAKFVVAFLMIVAASGAQALTVGPTKEIALYVNVGGALSAADHQDYTQLTVPSASKTYRDGDAIETNSEKMFALQDDVDLLNGYIMSGHSVQIAEPPTFVVLHNLAEGLRPKLRRNSDFATLYVQGLQYRVQLARSEMKAKIESAAKNCSGIDLGELKSQIAEYRKLEKTELPEDASELDRLGVSMRSALANMNRDGRSLTSAEHLCRSQTKQVPSAK